MKKNNWFSVIYISILATLGCGLVIILPANGQTEGVLPPQKFFEAIGRFHPLVKQADFFPQAANQELLMSRGQFDPKLRADFYRKSFDGKDYYNLFNPELKVPTWPGIDLKAGWERNVGPYVSNEHKTPQKGLQYVGVSVPVGQGLMTDVRRTTLKQARIAVSIAGAERLKEINKILFSAAKAYWEWYFNAAQLQLAQTAYTLANERYVAVKQRVFVGDQAPIDSVEAHIFKQDREIFLRQAQLDETNSRLMVSGFLWSETTEPVDLNAGASPEVPANYQLTISDSTAAALMAVAKTQHPEIQKNIFKLNNLELDRRLGREMLKPQLNLHYSWLSRTDTNIWAGNSIDRNYKFGFDFSFPLLVRKERGKLGLIRTKIIQTQLEQAQLQRDIEIEIRTTLNDIRNFEGQIFLQQQMVANYQRLRDGELKKFENGESSLFLINSREAKLIEARIKLVSLESKYQKERSALWYAAGRNPLLPLL